MSLRLASQYFPDGLARIVIQRVRNLRMTPHSRIVLFRAVDFERLLDGGEDIAHARRAAGHISAGLAGRSHNLASLIPPPARASDRTCAKAKIGPAADRPFA